MKDYKHGMDWLVKRAAMNICETEGDAWVLLCLMEKEWPVTTKEIHEELKDLRDLKDLSYAYGYSYRSVSRGLTNLVRNGLARRIRQGRYEPRLAPLLKEMMRLEDRGTYR